MAKAGKIIKTPAARLLDLTCGWSEFVQGEDGRVVDPSVTVDELCDLYQEAGRAVSDVPEGDTEHEKVVVRRFVEERIVPLLLRP
jgi:hypothetical protein